MAKIDDQLWMLLPEQDSVIYEEIKKLVNRNNPETSIKKSTFDFLCRWIETHPTTCSMLDLPPSISKKVHLAVILKPLNDRTCNKILAILMNSKAFDAELLEHFDLEIFPKLVNLLKKKNNKAFDHKFKLSLAFINNEQFRNGFFKIEDRMCDDFISKRRIFVLAIEKEKHFIEELINCDDATRSMLSNDVLKNSLFAVQLLMNIDRLNDHKKYLQEANHLLSTNNILGESSSENSSPNQQSTDLESSSPINTFKNNLFNELQRLFNLKESMISHIQLTSFASKFNVIDILYENMNLSKIHSQSVHSILKENSKYNHRFILHSTDPPNQLTEMELYNNFVVVKLLLEVIMDNQNVSTLNESSVEKLKEVKLLLGNVNAIETFMNILGVSFSLIFLRCEHLNGEEPVDLDRTIESGSESIKSPKCSKRSEKTAFICNIAALESIINLLKNLALQKLHSDAYMEADDSIKESYLRLYENINDAHSRVSLFYTNGTITTSRSTCFVNDDLKKYFNKHQYIARDSSNASSDDEVNGKQETSRRKPRKKNQFRKSADEKILGISNSTEHEQRSDTLHRSISASERRCPVSRMLGSPEHLATVCLNCGDFEAVKKIIQTNNLETSTPAKELQFIENYNETKEKLRTILDIYNSFENTAISNASTVEKLKQVATIGFEASQIQTIITTFATENEFHSNEEIRNLLNKLQRQYPFLKMFIGPSLQATIAVDLIISLTNSYEICFNIFNMLTKLWIEPNWLDDDGYYLGYLKFTKNICESLQLYQSITGNNFGVRELICNECYVLKPWELKVKLKKEKVMNNFQCLQPNEMDSLEKWKSLLKPFESIRGDVNYFNRSYNFLVNVKKLLKIRDANVDLPPMDIMLTDIPAVIGEIIFVREKLPMEIVDIVDNLNINFIYVLCLNTMPIINSCESDDSAVTESLFENIKNDNFLHENLDEKPLYCVNKEVFNFIRKNNYLVAYLHQEYNASVDSSVLYEQRYLKNVMDLDDVKTVSALYGDNLLLSALSYDLFDVTKLGKYLDNTENYRNAIRIIQSCSDRSLRRKGDQVKALEDVLITKLLKKCTNNCDLVEQINDVNIKSKYLLEHVLSIESSEMVKRLIQSILLHKNLVKLEQSLKQNLYEWLENVNIYDTIAEKMGCVNWVESRTLSINSSELILKRLMDEKEFEFCLNWLKMHPMSNTPAKFTEFCAIFKEIILTASELNCGIFKIIETLPLETVLMFYDGLLNEVQDLELLEYITTFLRANSTKPSAYQQYRISLKIFNQMDKKEQEINWRLFNTPLMIIEQYLMNSRHDTMLSMLKSIKPFLRNEKCKYCYARRCSTYDAKSSSDPDFKILLSENDFGHKDHSLSVHCIDSLLKIYAAKALDFRISETHSHSSNELLTHSMGSLDSLCGSFVMPKVAPDRLHWIKDEDAAHCMCCRRSAFTMLCRRHHCRRCGRVVCHACSTKRIEIPALYADVQVRSCDDCYKQIESNNQRKSSNASTSTAPVNAKTSDEVAVWQFSGNTKHDLLLREEFCFEYAPSVSLCLSILKFHSSDAECVNFLLYHCRKFESLLRPIQPGYPNPEIDYALVTRMMHCLALAAKVRGGPPECDTIRDHGEIIQSIVHHGCESLMPMEPPNSSSFRTLRDSLVLAEKWSLALELSLKCGFATTGVMAAWGIACLRAGCFDTAREKFAHCLTKTGDDSETYQIMSLILQESTDGLTEWKNLPTIRRAIKSPPLLDEILSILEVSCHTHQPEVIARASVIRDSNSSLASIRSKRREQIPLHEPALNIMHTLLSLKNVTRGIYDGSCTEKATSVGKKSILESAKCRKLIKCSRFHDECLYYLIRYGSHNSILIFLIKNEQLATALKYFLYQNVDADSFINVIFLPFLTNGKVDIIINLMMDMDETLLVWKDVIIKTCCYLEYKGLLNSLYHLQILLKDPVRASMTCVKFYSMNCSTYQELQNNSFHLINAQKHLQTELELCQWEEISVPSNNVTEDPQSILMKMDSRTLNSHINTIWRQIEVTKFLTKCEQRGCDTVALLSKISVDFNKIPTLFGTLQDKIQLAVLTIIAGSNINAGFGLAFRIIQDFNLSSIKVYGITAKYLSSNNRLEDVEKLIENIKSNSDTDSSLCDEIISLSIQTAVTSSPLNVPLKQSVDSLIRHVADVGIKISCHIIGGQLKSAYLLAVQYERFNDIRKVLRKAEQSNQQHIKKLCEKKLNAQK